MMAGSTARSTSQMEYQENEIEALQSIFADEIHVISNRGREYCKEISIKPNNLGVTFSFSITEAYPDVPPLIDIIPATFSLTENQTGILLQNMYTAAKDMKGTAMMLALIESAKDTLDEMDINYHRVLEQKSDDVKDCQIVCPFFQQGKCRFGTKCKNLHPGQKKMNKDKESELNGEEKKKVEGQKEEQVGGKKPPMKTACDVISRIQWDPELKSSHFIVGYLDRFLGVLEQPFDDFSWVDIATVDLNTLAIPRHRIQYFKYHDEIVWDKRVRLDNVFGSTGSQLTIADVAKKFQKESLAEDEKEADKDIKADKVEQNSKTEPQIKIVKKINKNEPNYFVAIRIDDEDILKNVKMVQDSVTENTKGLEAACATLDSLHITLCTMRLDSHDEKMAALKVLKEIRQEAARLLPPSLLLSFQGLGNFYERVLFSPPNKEPALYTFINRLQDKFREAGINLAGTRKQTNLHMTLVKLRRSDMDALCMEYLDDSYYSKFFHTYFGVQSVSTIHLCSMDNAKRYDGFYDCLASVNLFDEC
ncbi:uncharacterized protein [Antedon mediterranea]|uniref:uncharacterized protein n=1 Tax=Antedon mediterranea TaxID=105859 RepID=UPI003AF648B6